MAALLNTPTQMDATSAFDSPKFSPEKTFVQPKDDNLIRGGALIGNRNQARRGPALGAPKSSLNIVTPSRRPLGDRTNRKSNNEFTPLLKSVHKTNLNNNLDARINAVVARTPISVKHMEMYSGGTPQLPRGDSSGIDASSYNDENTPVGPQHADSSDVSTPIPRIGGKGGVLDDGQLTLREQEKIIDDIKKENFSLKLKIFFLDDRLAKLGPEFNDTAIRENIDLKVEHTTLRAELKRLKKALLDSERLVMELQGDAQAAQSNAQQRLADGKRADADAARIRDLLAELEDKDNQLELLRQENENLRLEFQDRDGTEREDAETIAALNRKVAELENEKEDLEADIRAKDEQLDNRQDADDKENEQLRDRIRELEEELQAKYDEEGNGVQEYQARIHDLQEEVAGKDEELKTMQEEHEAQIASARQQYQQKKATMKALQEVKDSLEQKVATLESERQGHDNELGDKVMDLEHDNRQLQNELDEIRDKIDDAIEQRNRMEDEMAVLMEKHKDEIARIREEYQERSIFMRNTAQDREDSRQRLQSDLLKLQEDLASMTTLHREKAAEVESLRNRISQLTNNFGGDVKALQIEITKLQEEKEQVKRQLEDTENQKNLLQLRHNTLTTESQQLQNDVTRLSRELSDLKANFSTEKQKYLNNEQFLKSQLAAEKNALEGEIDKLRAALDARDKDSRSRSDDWNVEKRQLELKITTAEQRVRGLEKTITGLKESEGNLHGYEIRLTKEVDTLKATHNDEIVSLNLQITNLNQDLERRKDMLEKSATELQAAKDEIRYIKKNERVLEEKTRSLDEELKSSNRQLSGELKDVHEQLADAESRCEMLKSEIKTYQESLAIAQSQLRNEQLNYKTSLDSIKTGTLSQEQLKIDLKNVEKRLEAVLKEKQGLHEKLLSANTQLASLKTDCQELEIEREEFKSQIKELTSQVGSRHKLDQEKVDLRMAKGRLEMELKRITEERDDLMSKTEEFELQLEELMAQAVADEQKLEDEIATLKSQMKSLGDVKEREAQLAKREAARLEARITELQDAQIDLVDPVELSEVKRDLEDARKREDQAREKIRDQRQKISKLEADLRGSRATKPRATDDTDAQIERQELHQHLMNARLQIEQMQGEMETKDNDIQLMLAREKELVARVKALKSDRTKLGTKATKAEEALLKYQSRLERAQEKLLHMQQTWDDERNLFEHKVMQNDVLTQKEMQATVSEQQRNHKAEIRGLGKQIQWLRARAERQEMFRRDLTFSKNYFLKQIEMFSACNELQLRMVEKMGILVDRRSRAKRPTLKVVAHAVIAVQRMKNWSSKWQVNKELKASLVKSLEKVRANAGRR
ncbi:hypothetical protein ABW19_dt0206648 [Dactylella cylindrospora]|nr:hypothetical protein ABW19_dt0206648 [Dactylella cylindrospora]